MKSALAIKEMHREAVSLSLHNSAPQVVMGPGSLVGKTPEATALLISSVAKPAPPQTTTPSHPTPLLKARNPQCLTSPPGIIPGEGPGPIPPVSAGNLKRQQQQGTTLLNKHLQSSNEVRTATGRSNSRGGGVPPSLHYSTPQVVIDPGSMAGKTPEVTALCISTTAKPVPPQTTTPSQAMPPLKARNPEVPHPPRCHPGRRPGIHNH